MTELAAVRYAIAGHQTIIYPKRILMASVVPALRPCAVSIRTGANLLELTHSYPSLEKVRRAAEAARAILKADVETVARGLVTILDLEYSPDRSVDEYREVARRYLKERLRLPGETRPVSIVRSYAQPGETGDSPSLRNSDANYLKRDHLFPGYTELAVLHEAVRDTLGNEEGIADWFDRGLANFLAYCIYLDRTGDLSGINLYRSYLRELAAAGYYLPDYDLLIANLVIQGWQGLLFTLLGARLRNPSAVRWEIIPGLIGRGRPLEEIKDKAFPDLATASYDFFPDKVVSRVLAALLGPARILTISPLAYALLAHLLRGREVPLGQLRAGWGANDDQFQQALSDLITSGLTVSSRGLVRPSASSRGLLDAGLVRVAMAGQPAGVDGPDTNEPA